MNLVAVKFRISAIVNIVLANDCVKINNQNLGESEYINYLELDFNELKQLIDNNVINSVGNKLAFYEMINMNCYKTD